MDGRIMPLAMLPAGCTGRIVGISHCGRGLARRISDMGLSCDSRLRVISSGGMGPVLVQVRDCSVAVGRGVARRILVAKEM